MDFLLSRYRNMTALLVVILAQLVLLAWQVKSGQDVRLIRVWAVTAVTPLARVLEFVRAHTIGAAENYFVLVNVRGDNERLKEELGRVKMENQFLRNELSTADRVRALQAFQERIPSRTLPARIIGTGTGANARVVFVDQGSSKGVMRGMAVVTPDGIVGKVLAAYPTASQVLLITDETFAAGVISEKNRVHGTVKGIGQSKILVQYVQNEEKVEVGEMFYTSGDDRVFPKGMPVGRATVVRPGNPFKEIFLVPSGFQQGLEEVLIVVEGVHGKIPDSEAVAAPGVYLMPPVETPKPEAGVQAQATGTPASGGGDPVLATEADRLRERYKRMGETQGHRYGEPTGRVPNFNLDPDTVRPGNGVNRPTGAGPAPVSGVHPPPPGSTATPGTAPPERVSQPATGVPAPAPGPPRLQSATPETGVRAQTAEPANATSTTGTAGQQPTLPRAQGAITQPQTTGTPRAAPAGLRTTAPREQGGELVQQRATGTGNATAGAQTTTPRPRGTRTADPQPGSPGDRTVPAAPQRQPATGSTTAPPNRDAAYQDSGAPRRQDGSPHRTTTPDRAPTPDRTTTRVTVPAPSRTVPPHKEEQRTGAPQR